MKRCRTGSEEGNMSEEADFQKLAKQFLDPSPEERVDLAKVRNLADAEVVLNYANIVKRLELPSLGFFVEYCPLRIKDRIAINEISHESEEILNDMRNRKTLFLILNRAKPELWTEERINDLPAMFVDAILMEYGQVEDDSFLLPIIARKLDGLTKATMLKSSS